jgi:uncharacterized surface protein with fasciclin (FAS1) repeats
MRTNSLKFLGLIAIFAIFTFSCSDIDKTLNSNDDSISQIAQTNPNLTILAAALERTDLVNTLDSEGTYTMFAPTDTAFNTYLSANSYVSIDDVPVAALKELLLNHVIGQVKKTIELPASGYVKTLAKGAASSTNTLSMYVNITGGIVKLNGGAKVTNANIYATNGFMNIVDQVIGLPSIVTHVSANPAFDTLESIVKSTSGTFGDQTAIATALTTNVTPLTVFAPTNTSFENATTGTGFAVGATASQFSTVLLYHVTGGNVESSTLTQDMIVPMSTVPVQNVTIDLVGGKKVKDQANFSSSIFAADIQCTNGIIHGVARVLQPAL